MKMRRRRDFSVRKAWRFAEKALTLHAKTIFFNLQGRVKFPIGGTVLKPPLGQNRCNYGTDSYSLDERRTL